MANRYDLIVLGGGSAGFAAAIKAAEADKRVALVEGGTIGGTCVNVGCVPSKTLIAAALNRYQAGHSPFRGIGVGTHAVDFATVMRQKAALVDELRQAKYLDVLASYPHITWIQGDGVLAGTDPVVLRVGDGTITAPRLIVATGAQPWAPPIPGLAETPYWTSTDALDATTLPQDLIVIGASAVGLEIGQFYHRLGTRVTVLEALDRIIPMEDNEISAILHSYLEEEGLALHPHAQIQEVRHTQGQFTVRVQVAGHRRELMAERLLVATGRRARTDGFGLAEHGVTLDRRGAIVVDDHLQSSVPTIYAAGDVTAQAMFVYVAASEGGIAASNALGLGSVVNDLSALPKVTFTDPQVASVGLTEEQAEAAGWHCLCRSLPLSYVPRALANRDTRGVVKLVVEQETERILGMHIVAPEAGEMIQVGVLAVKYEMTLADLTTLYFPYLTMVEGVKLAAITFHKDVEKLSCCAGA